MAIPLVIGALLAGGTLVPHAAGGMIVSGATGYVAGTYLSTTAITSVLSATTATAAIGTVAATNVGRSLFAKITTPIATKIAAIGSAAATATVGSIAGTAATSAGTVAAASINRSLFAKIAIPVAAKVAAVGSAVATGISGYAVVISGEMATGRAFWLLSLVLLSLSYFLIFRTALVLSKLREKISQTSESQEAHFTEAEAKIIEKIILKQRK
jgi:hypothetical protein